MTPANFPQPKSGDTADGWWQQWGFTQQQKPQKGAEVLVCACFQPRGAAHLQLPPFPLRLQVAASKDPVADATCSNNVEFGCGSDGDMDLGE